MTIQNNILAWDTATDITSAAILKITDSGQILSESVYLGKEDNTHSKNLMPGLLSLLKKEKLTFKDINCLALGLGPGSFTGLRVGLSMAKGISWALGCSVKATSSLDVLAWQAAVPKRLLVPVIDARHQQIFTSFYEYDEKNGLKKLSEPLSLFPNTFEKMLKEKVNQYKLKPLLFGPGADLLSGLFEIDDTIKTPCMIKLASLAFYKKIPQSSLNPIYVRPPAVY